MNEPALIFSPKRVVIEDIFLEADGAATRSGRKWPPW
jgi:hypothetical protein